MTTWQRPTVYGIVSDQIGDNMLLIHVPSTRIGTQVFPDDLQSFPSTPTPLQIRQWLQRLGLSEASVNILIGQKNPQEVLKDIAHIVADWAAWLNV